MPIDANYGLNVFQELQSGLGPWGDPNEGDTNWQDYFPTTLVQGDLDYLWMIGVRRLRFGGSDYSSNANFFLNRIAWYMYCVELALQKGFDVAFGIIPKFGIKPSEWKFFLDGCDPFIQQFQTLIDTYSGTGTYFIGNENEANFNLGRDPIVSMTRVSNVITIVVSLPHSLQTGDSIVYYNAASGNGSGSTIGVFSNSSHNITVVDATTFTFASTGTDATTTIGWYQYTSRTVRNTMKRLATHYKSLTSPAITVPLSYSCFQGFEVAGIAFYLDAFFTEGRGDIDFIDANLYGDLTNQEARFERFRLQVDSGYTKYGPDHFRVTEFNIWADDNGVPNDNPYYRNELITRRWKYIRSKANLKYYMFAYRMPAKLGEKFPFYSNASGGLRPSFYQMTGQRIGTVETT